MVLTVSFVISPVIGLIVTVALLAQNLTPASRRQDHTTSPSAFSTVRQRCLHSVHRIPSRVRDDRERPSVGRDRAIRKVFRVGEEARYFCAEGWTGDLRKCPRARHCERSEAIQLRTASWIASSPGSQRKRFAFVAGNDGARSSGMAPNAWAVGASVRRRNEGGDSPNDPGSRFAHPGYTSDRRACPPLPDLCDCAVRAGHQGVRLFARPPSSAGRRRTLRRPARQPRQVPPPTGPAFSPSPCGDGP